MSPTRPLDDNVGDASSSANGDVSGGAIGDGARPIRRVLVANRGEIACRVIRTLKTSGRHSIAVFSEADRSSLHVEAADEAVMIGQAAASESYLNIARIIETAVAANADAIHPGYGFLSENPAFARACAEAGIRFIGPRPEQMELFGLKHRAREAARAAGVPLLPGTGVLSGPEEALKEAARIGFPVMLKSSGGGGGIGMQICRRPEELERLYESASSLARRNFGNASLYLERFVESARHVEVQVFGDGKGGVAVLGDRDCSTQRRNQKVIEECPAPGLDESVRAKLHAAAKALCESASYESAGTVEFIYDSGRNEFYFLEVNTRLQVEHTVTEEVFRIDLVDWMIRQAERRWNLSEAAHLKPMGSAIQARLYAEDPGAGFRPSEGVVTDMSLPADLRLETWIRRGVHVNAYYDPLLAKLIAHGPDRETARRALATGLEKTRVHGIANNATYLAAVLGDPAFIEGPVNTSFLSTFRHNQHAVEILKPGTYTSVQDFPGRQGYWQVGIPPSGPMDSRSFRAGNALLGNDVRAAGLECVFEGPSLRFRDSLRFCVSGADMGAELDGIAIAPFAVHEAKPGSVLRMGRVRGHGQSAYILVEGGFDVPEYLGSRSTFTLGGFGGHGGRALREGDVLPVLRSPVGIEPRPTALNSDTEYAAANAAAGYGGLDGDYGGKLGFVAGNARFEIPSRVCLRVMAGPQGAPEFFKSADLEAFLDADWEVHFNSSRTGVRLIGPVPDWPRADGGEAGLHPSNIHDNPYVVGSMDFTGDMPILLGPDGPSLGGFVCPFTVISAELWKLGQLAAGMKVRLVPVSLEEARAARRENLPAWRWPEAREALVADDRTAESREAICATWTDGEGRSVILRYSGDKAVLIELGEAVLDIGYRLLVQWWLDRLEEARYPGITELTPGIRTLQIQFDDESMTWERLLPILRALADNCPPLDEIRVESRHVRLPLSWDDPATRLAIQKYTSSVRPDAPWAPSNIEFIRRINGLDSTEDVRRIVYGTEYLVLGLGDVYLGAPVATPLDPRHRLVTTKYNPARTWTPENAVGIGGAYLCVYGMEGPGGYQFVGRTVQMWNRYSESPDFSRPYLLRFFDRVSFYPVSAERLLELRADFPLGRFHVEIEEGSFSWRDYGAFLDANAAEISAFRAMQRAAFEAERLRWKAEGLDSFRSEQAAPADGASDALPKGCVAISSSVSGSLWKLLVKEGSRVREGDTVAIIESMKMEIRLESPGEGEVVSVFRREGESLHQGQTLAALRLGK